MKVASFVLATWIWWTAMVIAAQNVEHEYGTTLSYNYKLVSFSTEAITTGKYWRFLKEVKDELASGETSFGIPVMKAKSTIPASNRFLYIKLSNSENKFITLAMDVVNAYIVGYQAGTRAYLLEDIPTESNNLFPNIKGNSRVMLTFSGSYIDLERVAKADRSKIQLGFTPLKTAITDMYNWQSGSQQNMARGFLVCIQMVSEAARMEYIARLVGVATGFNPKNDIIRYETKWSDLSFRIQTADPKTGKFTQQPVELIDSNGEPYTVDEVTPKLQQDLSLLLRYTKKISQFSQAITSVVPNEKDIFVSIQNFEVKDMCLRANGGSTWLEICDDDAIEQQWAVYADGSIRPRQNKAQCLACKDDTQGCLLQILSCTGSSSDQRWVLNNDGTMFNLRHGLVMALSNSNIPSLHQIMVWPSIGRPNQLKWLA